jgi:hypothetical protein
MKYCPAVTILDDKDIRENDAHADPAETTATIVFLSPEKYEVVESYGTTVCPVMLYTRTLVKPNREKPPTKVNCMEYIRPEARTSEISRRNPR